MFEKQFPDEFEFVIIMSHDWVSISNHVQSFFLLSLQINDEFMSQPMRVIKSVELKWLINLMSCYICLYFIYVSNKMKSECHLKSYVGAINCVNIFQKRCFEIYIKAFSSNSNRHTILRTFIYLFNLGLYRNLRFSAIFLSHKHMFQPKYPPFWFLFMFGIYNQLLS